MNRIVLWTIFTTFASAFGGKHENAHTAFIIFIYMGKSCTASSRGILQDGNVAKVLGCSGAMQTACPPASLAQLARARDW